MKLAIIVGHEKKAPGADAVAPVKQSEYVFNTEIAEVMFRSAKECGMDCKIFFRDGVGISGAYKNVAAWFGAEKKVCAIELHFNACDAKAKGTETLYDKDPKESKTFAEIVQKHMVEVFERTGKADRGVRLKVSGDRGYGSLSACKAPSVIVEPFFGDTPSEAVLAAGKKWQYAHCLVEAAKEFLK